MSDKTFKQQVEKILPHDQQIRYGLSTCGGSEVLGYEHIPVKCKTCKILAAHNEELGRIAEGMPRWDYTTAENFGTFHAEDNALIRGRNKQYNECQAYIQAQKEESGV